MARGQESREGVQVDIEGGRTGRGSDRLSSKEVEEWVDQKTGQRSDKLQKVSNWKWELTRGACVSYIYNFGNFIKQLAIPLIFEVAVFMDYIKASGADLHGDSPSVIRATVATFPFSILLFLSTVLPTAVVPEFVTYCAFCACAGL